MAVRVKLSDGAEFTLDTNLEDFEKAVRLAMDNNRVLEVQNGNGKTRLLNPLQIVFVEEADESEEESAPAMSVPSRSS